MALPAFDAARFSKVEVPYNMAGGSCGFQVSHLANLLAIGQAIQKWLTSNPPRSTPPVSSLSSSQEFRIALSNGYSTVAMFWSLLLAVSEATTCARMFVANTKRVQACKLKSSPASFCRHYRIRVLACRKRYNPFVELSCCGGWICKVT